MAQTSTMKHKLRRMKRERTIAFKMLDLALSQRDQARLIAGALSKELDKKEPKKSDLEIVKIDEPPTEDLNDQPEQHSVIRLQTPEERARFLKDRNKYTKLGDPVEQSN